MKTEKEAGDDAASNEPEAETIAAGRRPKKNVGKGASPRTKKALAGRASRAAKTQRLAAVSKSISAVEEAAEAELLGAGLRRRLGRKKAQTRQFTESGTGDAMNI